MIKERDVKYVDFRFTDPQGKWQHTAQHVSTIGETSLEEGIMFDGSSIAGWKAINESDMCLDPIETAVMDPFAAQPLLCILFCDVLEPTTSQPYERDPRSLAKRAENFLKSTGVGDATYFGPEAEFFVFDDAQWNVSMNDTFYSLDSDEGPYNTGRIFDEELRLRPSIKGGYFPVPPVDSGTDLQAEMVHHDDRNGPGNGEASSRSSTVAA